MTSKIDERWQELFKVAMSEVTAWRGEHSRASFTEIEEALDKQLAGVRARLLQDLVESSPRADIRGRAKEERPKCPECGEPLLANGQHTREVTTTYEQRVQLTRSYGRCPVCGRGFFPPG
jgi:predicted RNA-binding Zn-ribbon protein involved in translation (DUF1610 family)